MCNNKDDNSNDIYSMERFCSEFKEDYIKNIDESKYLDENKYEKIRKFWDTSLNDIEQITLKSTIEYDLESKIRKNIIYRMYISIIFALGKYKNRNRIENYLWSEGCNIDADVMGKIRQSKWFQNKVNTKFEKELKFKLSNP